MDAGDKLREIPLQQHTTVTWARWRLQSPADRQFVQQINKAPSQGLHNADSVSTSWRHNGTFMTFPHSKSIYKYEILLKVHVIFFF